MIPTTVALKRTSIFITTNKITCLPLFTHFKGIIGKIMRFTAKVLPVVRINALGFVVFLVIGTPFCLEVIHVEVVVFRHLMNKRCFNIKIWMGERTILLILTILFGFCTKLCFITFDMIKALNLVMCKGTILVLAVFCLTKVNRVRNYGWTTTLIQITMVVWTVDWIVLNWICTRHSFEPF